MSSVVAHRPRALEYDAIRRRLWIFGQRCHHGAGGSLLAGLACVRLVKGRAGTWTLALATGSVLMVHDWKDRGLWFERGHGSQP